MADRGCRRASRLPSAGEHTAQLMRTGGEMSLTAIVNLAERILNNSSKGSGDSNVSSKRSKPVATVNAESNSGDQFTPSVANEVDAGLFQVTQISLLSAAAEFFLSRTNSPQGNSPVVPAEAPLGARATPAISLPTTSAAQNSPQALASTANTVHAGSSTPSVAPTATASAPLATPLASSTISAVGSSLSQLQSLNNALSALGLDPAELAQVDRIASLIQDFSPLAFTSLVYQIEALANANTSQSVAATPNNSNAGTVAATGNTSGVNATGGFQVSELAIKFSGVQEESIAPVGANAQSGSPSIQFSAFNLQVQEVNLTLTNQAGQSVQVNAPKTATSAASHGSGFATPSAKSATA